MSSPLGFLPKDEIFSNLGVAQTVAQPQTVVATLVKATNAVFETLACTTLNLETFNITNGSINGITVLTIGTLNANTVATTNLDVSNSIVFTSSNGKTTTIQSAAPASSVVYTVPDAGASSAFVLTNGNQTLNGVTTFAQGILLPTLNGTAFNFNFYQEQTGTISFTSLTFTGTQTVNYFFVRVGRCVTFSVASFNVASVAGSDGIQGLLATPTNVFNPVVIVNAPVNVLDKGSQALGLVQISGGPSMQVNLTPYQPQSLTGIVTPSLFVGGSGNVGWSAFSVSWYTAN